LVLNIFLQVIVIKEEEEDTRVVGIPPVVVDTLLTKEDTKQVTKAKVDIKAVIKVKDNKVMEVVEVMASKVR
jgi:hypothetical protein